jgi:exodeoxyribonuclease-3
MKIYSWNVNGIRAVEKKGLLKPFFTSEQPDILCVQETKAQPEQVEADFAELYPEYEQFWHSAEKKGYSGTAIFTKIPPIEAIYGIPDDIQEQFELNDTYGDTTKEGRVLTLEFDHFYLSTVYTPNAKDDLSRIPMREHWDPAYLMYMKRLQAEKPVIFCGDFNVAHTELDLARPKPNEGKKGFTEEERSGFTAMIEADFVDTLRVFFPDTPDLYTWWSHWGGARERNVGWRIDYVMVHASLASLLKNAKIHPEVLGSDHCPVSIDITLPTT